MSIGVFDLESALKMKEQLERTGFVIEHTATHQPARKRQVHNEYGLRWAKADGTITAYDSSTDTFGKGEAKIQRVQFENGDLKALFDQGTLSVYNPAGEITDGTLIGIQYDNRGFWMVTVENCE